jgi:uncharacterized SAM-binding protein YcdF (DUF218 family)
MFFGLSKIFWLFAAPSSLLLLLISASFICLLLKWRVAALRFGLAAGGIFLLIGIFPVQNILLRHLENQHPRAGWPARVDGVLILGGGLDWRVLQSRGVPAPEAGTARLLSGYEVARRYPGAKVIFAGGSAELGAAALSEGDGARHFFGQMGLAPERLILEQGSRNTYENILFARKIANPKPGQVWLLATSALHMPRAMGVARKLGWDIQPWPTDYITIPTGFFGILEYARNLDRADYAVREGLGLLVYRLTGRS